jgi:hypothetical protein
MLRRRPSVQGPRRRVDDSDVEDSFSFRAAVPLRRRLDARVVRAAVAAAVVLVAVATFARWVIASERRSLERAAGSAETARVATVPPANANPVQDPDATAADAREALALAVDAARAAFVLDGTFLAADPARLTDLQPGFSFVDGPSTTPSVVSVASTDGAWGAAVLAPGGTCLWALTTVDGRVARAEGAECTGAAALAALASDRT